MLSIGRVRRGRQGKRYYLALHEEDYYLRQGAGEPPGQWAGRLCVDFGLRGLVGEKDFCNLFDATSPTGERLRRQQKNGRPAFDLTYSVSKDLSIIYMLAGPKLKREIEATIYASVKASLGYAEDEACKTRLGAGGCEVVRGDGFAVSLFLHLISRGLDPQLHVHAVVFNFTRGPDGAYRSLDASKLYEHKHAAGALFRTELAARLEVLGFEIERDRFSFSIKGVPQSLKDEFSKRSQQIREELGDKEATPKQKDRAALRSREPKQDVDRDKLLAEWQEVAKRHGFTAEQVLELIASPTLKERDERAELRAAVSEGVKQLTSTKSSFTERELIEQTAIEGQTRGLSAQQVRHGVFAKLEPARRVKVEAQRHEYRDSDMVRLGEHQDGYERFTTGELYRLEQEIIQMADHGRQSAKHCVSDATLAKALSSKPTLKTEQVEAATHITQGPGSVKCVSGWAGTGKTYMLDAARDAWEKDGYTVLGSALSGKAASELSEGAHIKSVTIAKLIYDLDNPGYRDRLTLDSKTVLVVDEAGMVGTRALHRLVTEAERAGARLVLVGDEKQLQSIDAGGGFSGLSKRLGYVELKEITRQRHAADRQAVYDFAEGNPEAALKSYSDRGRLILGENRVDAMQLLMADWLHDKTKIEEKLILSSTNRQAATLNQLCQEARLRRGELDREGRTVTVRDGVTVHAGDRVLFTRNDKHVGVNNGNLATVVEVTTGDEREHGYPEQEGAITVRLDSGKVLTVSLSTYDRDNITLGYSVTTHKAQGATVENAYVFLYGAMTDQQMVYVQASRARNATRFYTTDDEAGPELSDLTESMSRSRKKTFAHDTLQEGEKQRQGRGVSLSHKLCYNL